MTLKEGTIEEITDEDVDVMVQFVLLKNGSIGVVSDPKIYNDAAVHLQVFSTLNAFIKLMVKEASPEVTKILENKNIQNVKFMGHSNQIH